MPPKKTPNTNETKTANPEEDIIEAFTNKLQTLAQLAQNPAADDKAKKKAFKALAPYMQSLIKNDNRSDSPLLYKILTIGQKIAKANIQLNLGLAYMHMKDFTRARQFMQKAKSADLYLQPHFYLITLELLANRPNEVRQERELLLNRAVQNKHAVEAAESADEISHHAIGLLKSYLSTPQLEINFREFFSKYSKFLGVTGYTLMIDFQKGNPTEQANWRSKLFKFISKEAITDFTNTRHFYLDQINYYIAKNNYLKCYTFIETNLQRLEPEELAQMANLLYLYANTQPEISHETLKSWFNMAATTRNEAAVKFYLDILYNNRNYFNKDQAIKILDIACQLDSLKGYGHYIYAILYKEGYGQLNDDQESFKHNKLAVKYQYLPAWTIFAYKHAHGWGTEVNFSAAFDLLEKAHHLGSLDAGWAWVEVLLFKASSFPAADLEKKLIQAQSFLNDCQARSNNYHAKIAQLRAYCLIFLDALESNITIKTRFTMTNKAEGALSFVGFTPSSRKNPAIIEALEIAVHQGNGQFQLESALTLGNYYVSGTAIETNLVKGLETFEKVLSESPADDSEFNTFFQYYLSMVCGSTLLLQCEQESNVSNKRALQLKALHYFQKNLTQEDDLPPMVKYFADQIYKRQDSGISQQTHTPLQLYQYYSNQVQSNLEDPWKDHVKQLRNLLNEPGLKKNLANLEKITTHVQAINEHLLDIPELLPLLEQFVSDYVLQAANWNAVLSAFSLVGKWHLSSATAALEPLFMHLRQELHGKSLPARIQALKIVAQCNFKPQVQEMYFPSIVRLITPDDHLSISDGSLLFNTLALLDCNHANSMYLDLVKPLFTALKGKASSAGHIEASQLYHALNYFLLYYPQEKEWNITADLKKSFEIYSASLCVKPKHVSNTQDIIHRRLLQLFDPKQVKTEVFIDLAGRRVDFLIGKNIIIQYNGSRFHCMWDNAAESDYDSLKEQLSYKTLTAPLVKEHYYVIRIHRKTWAKLKTEAEQLRYLQRRLDSLPIQLREDSDSSERKMPFLDNMAQEVTPKAFDTTSLTLG